MRVVVALAVGLLGCRYHFGEQPSSDGQLEDVTSACTPGTVSAPRAATDCPFGCHNPKLRWIGDRYVLCWKQETSADESTPNELLCTTLDRDGVQASPPRIIPVAGEPTSMSLTWSGSDFVLSYTANPTGDYEIYMLRFDTAFSPQPVVRVTNGSGTGWGTANAWTGSQVGISFYDYTTEVDPSIYFARLATDGSLLGTTRLTTGFRAFGTSLAWTGAEYIIGWRDIRDSGTWDIYLAPIDTSGNVTGPVRVTDDTMLAVDHSLAWNANSLGVAYVVGSAAAEEVYFSVRDRTGAALAAETRITNAAGSSHAVKVVGLGAAGFALGFFDARDGSDQLALQRLDVMGARIGSELLVPGATSQLTGMAPNPPAMAASDRGVAVVWSQGTTADAEIMFLELCP